MGRKARPETEALKAPARLVAELAKWVGRQDARVSAGEKNENGGFKRPARLTAELAEWIGSKDNRALQGAFRKVGLEVLERKPEHHYVHEYYGQKAHKLRSGLQDDEFLPLAAEVWEQKRTFLYYNRLYTLHQGVRNIARAFPSGTLRFLEIGAFRGGSAYFLARTAERYATERVELTAVDTFEGHSAEDLPSGEEGVHKEGTFSATSVEEVREYLSPFPFVEVVQGRIQDVAPTLEGELHLVHIDVDIYAPTRFALGMVAEQLVPGGIAIVDDYGFTTCPGARRALDEFIEERPGAFMVHALDSGQALVVRTG
jgi:O-methyltransferase